MEHKKSTRHERRLQIKRDKKKARNNPEYQARKKLRIETRALPENVEKRRLKREKKKELIQAKADTKYFYKNRQNILADKKEWSNICISALGLDDKYYFIDYINYYAESSTEKKIELDRTEILNYLNHITILEKDCYDGYKDRFNSSTYKPQMIEIMDVKGSRLEEETQYYYPLWLQLQAIFTTMGIHSSLEALKKNKGISLGNYWKFKKALKLKREECEAIMKGDKVDIISIEPKLSAEEEVKENG